MYFGADGGAPKGIFASGGWLVSDWPDGLVILGLLLLIVLVFVLGRWRDRLLLARSQELEEQVQERTAELTMAIRQLEKLALFDELTNLPNQRSFWDAARRLEARARRHGTAFGLIVLDLDHFKKINDQWGHRVGDQVLRHATGMLAQVVRDEDLLARYGGEEFVVLLSESSIDEAEKAAERLRAHLQGHPYRIEEDLWIQITASFGLSVWQGPGDSVDDLFRRADTALYAAKIDRNAVVAWSPGIDEQAERVG